MCAWPPADCHGLSSEALLRHLHEHFFVIQMMNCSFDAQSMVDTSSRETFRDRILMGKLCNSPQEFLADIRKVHADDMFTSDCECLASC